MEWKTHTLITLDPQSMVRNGTRGPQLTDWAVDLNFDLRPSSENGWISPCSLFCFPFTVFFPWQVYFNSLQSCVYTMDSLPGVFWICYGWWYEFSKQENSIGKSFCSMHYSVWNMPWVGLLKYMFYYLSSGSLSIAASIIYYYCWES